MDCWTGVLKVPLAPSSTSYCRVAVSLCLSTASKTLAVSSFSISALKNLKIKIELFKFI